MMAHDPNAFPDGARRFRLRAFPERFWMFLSRVSKCFCNSSVSERFLPRCSRPDPPAGAGVRVQRPEVGRRHLHGQPGPTLPTPYDQTLRADPPRHPMAKPYAPTLPALYGQTLRADPPRHAMAKPYAPTLPAPYGQTLRAVTMFVDEHPLHTDGDRAGLQVRRRRKVRGQHSPLLPCTAHRLSATAFHRPSTPPFAIRSLPFLDLSPPLTGQRPGRAGDEDRGLDAGHHRVVRPCATKEMTCREVRQRLQHPSRFCVAVSAAVSLKHRAVGAGTSTWRATS